MKNIIENYDLFIFDLDDTLVSTERYHYKAWITVLKNKIDKNFSISFEYFCEKFHSKDPDSIKKYLINQLNLDNFDQLIIDKKNTYLSILEQYKDDLKLIDGTEEFLNLIIKNNKKFVIVSNSFKSNIDFFIELFPILSKSSKNYYREMFINKKPNPECYLLVVSDFPNCKSIGFEDSITGIESLTKVKSITPIFINTPSYIYYNFIINNYHDLITIKNYKELNEYYIENKAINTLRILSVDMIEKANSGHPGMPLGCAPMMFVLWCKIMKFNPFNPLWEERDRFILSNGHGCALLYSILHLLGYNYSLDDLKNFRQLHSKTPGHPEYNPLLGIECSTGPLGQGIANGVGMAIASKKMGYNNNIYVMCGDGCLMEGISYEASSLAGHLKLNNLIILYDDNGITIDGSTDITMSEDIRGRFNALGWNILNVVDGDKDINDIYDKILLAKKSMEKPTIIFVKTTIGFGASNSGCSSVHGSPLGIENTKSLKKYFNFNENEYFSIDKDVIEYFKKIINSKIFYYEQIIIKEEIKIDVNRAILEISEVKNGNKNYATRDISNILLNIIVKNIPHMIVGSADLTDSNKTSITSSIIKYNDFNGNYLHYGIREHAMASIANGISTFGILPVVSTFLVFITYCLASIRMAALSKHKVIYIFTHDSVLLGEDGPTHQPIESLTILRSIPNLITIRPADINETSGAYQIALEYNGPTALILSRQILPNINTTNSNKIKYGAYIVYEPENMIDFIIVATGSEVSLAIDTAKLLNDTESISIRVVSMPCCNLFDIQSIEYQEKILPKNIKSMSLEAGCTLGWYKYVNYAYGIDTFGESAKINNLKEYFGLTVIKIKEYILKKIYAFKV